MSLRLKPGVPLEQLRPFGFAPGAELAKRPEYEWLFHGCDALMRDWHMFKCDEGIPVTDIDGNPQIHARIDTRDETNLLWFEVTPCGTYHTEMYDLELVTSTIFALTQAGLIEQDSSVGT